MIRYYERDVPADSLHPLLVTSEDGDVLGLAPSHTPIVALKPRPVRFVSDLYWTIESANGHILFRYAATVGFRFRVWALFSNADHRWVPVLALRSGKGRHTVAYLSKGLDREGNEAFFRRFPAVSLLVTDSAMTPRQTASGSKRMRGCAERLRRLMANSQHMSSQKLPSNAFPEVRK
jgi:hypothetical protein